MRRRTLFASAAGKIGATTNSMQLQTEALLIQVF